MQTFWGVVNLVILVLLVYVGLKVIWKGLRG
jgi:hypothetical protein